MSKTFTRTIPNTNMITIISPCPPAFPPKSSSPQQQQWSGERQIHSYVRTCSPLCLQGNYVRQCQHLHLNESMSVGFAPLVPPSLTTKASCERAWEKQRKRKCMSGSQCQTHLYLRLQKRQRESGGFFSYVDYCDHALGCYCYVGHANIDKQKPKKKNKGEKLKHARSIETIGMKCRAKTYREKWRSRNSRRWVLVQFISTSEFYRRNYPVVFCSNNGEDTTRSEG